MEHAVFLGTRAFIKAIKPTKPKLTKSAGQTDDSDDEEPEAKIGQLIGSAQSSGC